jgi:ABC-type polysaccharide/polyol phosphate transport system ATPase subunit
MGVRLGFSVTVHTDPDVLLVDEVLAVGDAAFKEKCLDRVRELRDGGCAVMLVTHQMDLVKREADRVMVLHRGEQTFTGPSRDAIEHYLGLSGARPDQQDFSPRAIYEGRSRKPTRPGPVA